MGYLNLASPGILVREVDLTTGRVDATSDSIGALCSPFAKGPVSQPTLIESEQDLLNVFGSAYSADRHYEHWISASSYLAYGGALRVVRADGTALKNACADDTPGIAFTGTAIKIKNDLDFESTGYLENGISGVSFVAQTPGTWANNVTICVVDGQADQQMTGINTTQFASVVGVGTTQSVRVTHSLQVGYGVTQAVPANTVLAGAGSTSLLDGFFKGIITGISSAKGGTIDVKFHSHVSTAGTETEVDYTPTGIYRFADSGSLAFHTVDNVTIGVTTLTNSDVAYGTTSYTGENDWFDNQYVGIDNNNFKWNAVADRPGTSQYCSERNSRHDEMHILVIDDKGLITGVPGQILEKHFNLSKAKDATSSVATPSWYRKYLVEDSDYIFGGNQPVGVTTSSFQKNKFEQDSDVNWNQDAQDISFAGRGAWKVVMSKGVNYAASGLTGEFAASVGNIYAGYELFENPEEIEIDFLIMGSANYSKEGAAAIANKLIEVAELRKDAVAFISPYRGAFLTDDALNPTSEILAKITGYYAPVTSSSFAVLDSGYKYTFDRFNKEFRWVPMNADIAGLCARTDINNFPWYSPAGTSRGAILNAVKLAFNPGKRARDELYSNRINPITFNPGGGIILFGDKTGLAKASAFDRINVRRLFIFLEKAISAAARDQLFEFNDDITRTNFVNIIEPFLRDVQAKRGISDFLVVCDETNNTPDVIDRNEFIADIFIKPARSINFIGLTFVATRTGISFEEVVGRV